MLSSCTVNPERYSIDSKPFGTPYRDWIAKFWQWMISIPQPSNPNYGSYTDINIKCSINQTDPHVWFLVPTFGGPAERTCTIPSGKAILFPVISGECNFLESPDKKTYSELRQCAMEGDEGAVMKVKVDGIEMKDLEQYRVQTDPFDLTIPKNNVFSAPPGQTKAVADGFYTFLKPFSPGKHDIEFSGSIVDVNKGTSYSTDVKYHLTVR